MSCYHSETPQSSYLKFHWWLTNKVNYVWAFKHVKQLEKRLADGRESDFKSQPGAAGNKALHIVFICIQIFVWNFKINSELMSYYKAVLPRAGASGLKGLGETAGLNAGTVHTRLSLTMCLLKKSHVQI